MNIWKRRDRNCLWCNRPCSGTEKGLRKHLYQRNRRRCYPLYSGSYPDVRCHCIQPAGLHHHSHRIHPAASGRRWCLFHCAGQHHKWKLRHPAAGRRIYTGRKTIQKENRSFTTAYWCIVTAIYLVWSFQTREWDKTWILWAVAGVLFGGVRAVMRGRIKEK